MLAVGIYVEHRRLNSEETTIRTEEFKGTEWSPIKKVLKDETFRLWAVLSSDDNLPVLGNLVNTSLHERKKDLLLSHLMNVWMEHDNVIPAL